MKEYPHAIGWGDTTHSLWINPVAFQQDVLRYYFPGINKFASFTRKMNRYGFKRIADRTEHQEPNDIFYFRHAIFHKGISLETAKTIRIQHKRLFTKVANSSALNQSTTADGSTSAVLGSPLAVLALPGIPSPAEPPLLGEHSSVLDTSTILELVYNLNPDSAASGILRQSIPYSALPSRNVYHAIHPEITGVHDAYGTGVLYSGWLTGGSLPPVLPSAMTNILGSRKVLVRSSSCSGSGGVGGRTRNNSIGPFLLGNHGSPDALLRNLLPYTSRISDSMHAWDAAISLRMHCLGPYNYR